jgi:hypothetical protein
MSTDGSDLVSVEGLGRPKSWESADSLQTSPLIQRAPDGWRANFGSDRQFSVPTDAAMQGSQIGGFLVSRQTFAAPKTLGRSRNPFDTVGAGNVTLWVPWYPKENLNGTHAFVVRQVRRYKLRPSPKRPPRPAAA